MSGPERRDQLLGVARDLFVRDGYRATTADVASGAGVSDALVVKHFGTKEGLFRAAIVEPVFELLEEALRDGREWALNDDLEDPAHHFENITRFAEGWVTAVAEHKALLLGLVRESAAFAEDAAHMLDLGRQLVEDLAEALQRYARSPQYVDFDALAITYATIGALTMGAVVSEDPLAFARQYVEMVHFGLRTVETR